MVAAAVGSDVVGNLPPGHLGGVEVRAVRQFADALFEEAELDGSLSVRVRAVVWWGRLGWGVS